MRNALTFLAQVPDTERPKFVAGIVHALTLSPVEDAAEGQAPADIVEASEEVRRVLRDSSSSRERAEIWDALASEITSQTMKDPVRRSAALGRLVRRDLIRPSSLRVKYGGGIADFMRGAVTRKHMEQALQQPDQLQVIEFGEDSIVLFTKAHRSKTGAADSTLIAYGKVTGDELLIGFAARAFHDLVDLRQAREPLDALRAFVARYGREFAVNAIPGKRFIEYEVFTAGFHPDQDHRPGVSYLQPAYIRTSPLGVTEVRLTFRIDTKMYEAEIARMQR